MLPRKFMRFNRSMQFIQPRNTMFVQICCLQWIVWVRAPYFFIICSEGGYKNNPIDHFGVPKKPLGRPKRLCWGPLQTPLRGLGLICRVQDAPSSICAVRLTSFWPFLRAPDASWRCLGGVSKSNLLKHCFFKDVPYENTVFADPKAPPKPCQNHSVGCHRWML